MEYLRIVIFILYIFYFTSVLVIVCRKALIKY